MDRETGAAFERLWKSLDLLDTKLDMMREELAEHRIDEARSISEILASTKSAHHRIDGCEERQKEKRGHAATLWIGVFLALLGSALSWVFGGKKP